MRIRLLTLGAGLSLLIPTLVWFGGLSNDGPALLYPFPVLIFVSTIIFRQAAIVLPVALFFVWNPALFRGEARIPTRSYILLTVSTVLNVFWFVVSWKDGLAVQGATYVYRVAGVNAVWMAFLWFLLSWGRKERASFPINLILHWLLFVWLAWYAFPFLGEIT